jgi:hypothetical protein
MFVHSFVHTHLKDDPIFLEHILIHPQSKRNYLWTFFFHPHSKHNYSLTSNRRSWHTPVLFVFFYIQSKILAHSRSVRIFLHTVEVFGTLPFCLYFSNTFLRCSGFLCLRARRRALCLPVRHLRQRHNCECQKPSIDLSL